MVTESCLSTGNGADENEVTNRAEPKDKNVNR